MRLCGALYRLCCYFQTSECLHLFPAMIEGRVLAHQSLHPAHPRRAVAAFDVELAIDWELAVVTVRTQVPRAQEFHLTQHREKRPRAQFAVARLVTARAANVALFGDRLGEL